MDAISLKLDGNMLKRIDEALQEHNYSTRTEFVRDALRRRLEELNTTHQQSDPEKSFYHG